MLQISKLSGFNVPVCLWPLQIISVVDALTNQVLFFLLMLMSFKQRLSSICMLQFIYLHAKDHI